MALQGQCVRQDRRCSVCQTVDKRMVAELIQFIEVYPAVKEDGITNQQVTIHYNCIGALTVPDRRKIPRAGYSAANEKKRSIKLRLHTDRHINLEIKNAEYHPKTFSDPFMILRMSCVDKKDAGNTERQNWPSGRRRRGNSFRPSM